MKSPETIDRDNLFIELSDGGRWYPSRPDNTISVYQVAHALSNIGRFTGHARRVKGHTYTVAEHSVKVSWLVPTLTGLMHDAHESITNDLSKPIKVYMGGSYKELEEVTERRFAEIFGLTYPHGPEIKKADILMVLIESFDLLTSHGMDWGYYQEYLPEAFKLYLEQPELRPQGWSPDIAEHMFIDRFSELRNGC